ncbi:MAG: HU family DNA-binding protein [Magnetococcales bacterium]|uniref:HU family DNA-binding protein n=1 Tax=Candidatus Magnetobacterium casense TaxID=1455061 RepID=A0ABS6RVC6_9BACT|nr:HU family DNA-binding protein [Nitrospirota bacterium]MBV6340300.1 HU family DNA-binding protein [Candidatus Magnetobacterium casensis]
MNKADLVDSITKATSLTKSDTAKFVDAFISNVITATSNGEKVYLVGFGAFSISERKEREGRNPRTGEPIVIPAAKSPKFTAGKAFKDAVADNNAKLEPVAVKNDTKAKTEPAKKK